MSNLVYQFVLHLKFIKDESNPAKYSKGRNIRECYT